MTDSKTATERLRELLDERGVKWWEGWNKSQTVFDGANDVRYMVDCMFGQLYIRSVLPITHEQAIAATLWSDREQALEKKVRLQGDYIDKLTKEKDALFAQNCEAATRHAGQIDMMQRKLDAATLGSGECENIAKYWGEFECSECDTWADFGIDLHLVSYCPHCGKKVKR